MGAKRWMAALALCLAPVAWGQDLVMAVSEGTSGGLDHAQVITKYQGLAEVVGRAIRRKVNVVFAREFAQLEDGMKSARFDFVLARPSDYPARAVRQHGYQHVATALPDGQCLVIAPKGSAIRTVADLHGKRLVLPEPAAYMAKFCQAELRDQGIDLAKENVKYVREQGAVAFYLENGFADAGGIASYSGIARKWVKDGHAVVHRSRPQPYFPLVASARITEAQIAEIRKALAAMHRTEADQPVLRTVGVEAFDVGTARRLDALLDWLGGP